MGEPGRPKEHHEERVTTAVRIPRKLHKQLKREAVERDSSVNHLIVKAAQYYLDRLPPLEATE